MKEYTSKTTQLLYRKSCGSMLFFRGKISGQALSTNKKQCPMANDINVSQPSAPIAAAH